jgi:ABC-type polysaccharide/polyol phosphate export permease
MKRIKYYLNLIYELSWLDFKLKYYGSVLGLFWSFLKPFMMLAILYVVFFYFMKVGIPDYHIYLLIGIVLWNFFADATKDSTQSISSKANILQKTNISPLVVVISAITHSFWTLIITLGIFFVIFFTVGFHLYWSVIILPILILLMVLLVIGVSFLIVPLYMRFRDFGHIWDIFLQMLFWITPLVYEYKVVPDEYIKWYLLNPVARIIIDARNATLYNFFPEVKQLLITAAIVAVILIAGWFVFKKYGREFVEQL